MSFARYIMASFLLTSLLLMNSALQVSTTFFASCMESCAQIDAYCSSSVMILYSRARIAKAIPLGM